MESHLEAKWAERFQAASVRITGRKWGSWEEAQHQEGGRQVKQTGFPEAAWRRANKQLQSIEASRAGSSRACSWSAVWAKPPHGEPLLCSLPPSPRAAPGRQAGITQPPCQECDSSAGGRMSLYMPAFPAAKAARPTPPSLGKVSPSAELQALERPGVSRKIQNFGFYPSLRGEYFPHIFQDQQQANCSNGKCNLWLPGLLWSERILLDRGMGYYPVGVSSSNIEGLKGYI